MRVRMRAGVGRVSQDHLPIAVKFSIPRGMMISGGAVSFFCNLKRKKKGYSNHTRNLPLSIHIFGV
jgi:hypothetical protein